MDGAQHWVTFKYERLPMLCHYCGVLGHDLRHCASYFAASKQGTEVKLQYGDWLKATGGRSRSPVKHSAEQDHMPSSEKGKDRGDVHSGRSVGKSREMTAETTTNGCPREAERHENGNGTKSGGVTDIQLQNSALKAIMRADLERVENNDMGGSNVNVNLKATMKLNKESNEVKETDRERMEANLNAKIMEDSTHTVHVDVTMQDGLANRNPNGMWTRFCRKDYGSGEKESGEQHSVLGKWVLTDTVGNDYHMDLEAHTGKQGRAESHRKGENEISTRVADHPC